jgi:hypothetical protein
MAHIEVIYDPQKELAAIVDLDTQEAYGPAMIGPDAGSVLEMWLETLPFDITLLDHHAAVTAFRGSVLRAYGEAAPEAATSPTRPVEPGDGQPVDGEALAEFEAAQAGAGPPEPQPADTDVAADQGTPPTVVTCPLCSGAKVLVDDETGEQAACGMCRGTGLVSMAVPS